MSTPDVTSDRNNQVLRPDDMELLTKTDRVPERLRRLERAAALSGAVGQAKDIWHIVGEPGEPIWLNTWKSYGGTPGKAYVYDQSGTYGAVSFTKDPSGLVTIRGFAITPSAQTAGTAMFTLPVGYRPPKQLLIDQNINGTTESRIDILANGNVTVSPAMTANWWITLDCSFDTETVSTSAPPLKGDAGATGAPGQQGNPGPAGGKGDPGPIGPPGVLEVYEQPNAPGTTTEGALWIDTDEEPPVWAGAPPSGADKTYVHTQSTLAASWTVAHQLNKFPSVTVVDSGGSIIEPNVHYDSNYQVTVTFGAATSGKAYCN